METIFYSIVAMTTDVYFTSLLGSWCSLTSVYCLWCSTKYGSVFENLLLLQIAINIFSKSSISLRRFFWALFYNIHNLRESQTFSELFVFLIASNRQRSQREQLWNNRWRGKWPSFYNTICGTVLSSSPSRLILITEIA